MPEKRPGGPMPTQTGTTQKTPPASGKDTPPAQLKPGAKVGGGKGGKK